MPPFRALTERERERHLAMGMPTAPFREKSPVRLKKIPFGYVYPGFLHLVGTVLCLKTRLAPVSTHQALPISWHFMAHSVY